MSANAIIFFVKFKCKTSTKYYHLVLNIVCVTQSTTSIVREPQSSGMRQIRQMVSAFLHASVRYNKQ